MKQIRLPPFLRRHMSPPARGRGLKPIGISLIFIFISVAPRAGAWIETLSPVLWENEAGRRPPCGGVD